MAEARSPKYVISGNRIIDLYWEDNGTRLEQTYWNGAGGRLSPTELIFFSIWYMDGEIANGGLAQAIFNHGGELVPGAVAALRTIGAPELAEMLQDVIDLLPSIDWNDQEDRENTLAESEDDELDELLEEFDEQWIESASALYSGLAAFLLRVGAGSAN